jgi:hypothetical protein
MEILLLYFFHVPELELCRSKEASFWLILEYRNQLQVNKKSKEVSFKRIIRVRKSAMGE